MGTPVHPITAPLVLEPSMRKSSLRVVNIANLQKKEIGQSLTQETPDKEKGDVIINLFCTGVTCSYFFVFRRGWKIYAFLLSCSKTGLSHSLDHKNALLKESALCEASDDICCIQRFFSLLLVNRLCNYGVFHCFSRKDQSWLPCISSKGAFWKLLCHLCIALVNCVDLAYVLLFAMFCACKGLSSVLLSVVVRFFFFPLSSLALRWIFVPPTLLIWNTMVTKWHISLSFFSYLSQLEWAQCILIGNQT